MAFHSLLEVRINDVGVLCVVRLLYEFDHFGTTLGHSGGDLQLPHVFPVLWVGKDLPEYLFYSLFIESRVLEGHSLGHVGGRDQFEVQQFSSLLIDQEL